MTVSAVSGRHYTVKEINPSGYRLNNIGRRPDPHQISRTVFRHPLFNRFNRIIHLFMCFTDCQSAYSISGKFQFGNTFHMLDTEVMKHSSLIDPEQQLPRIDRIVLLPVSLPCVPAAQQPLIGTKNRFFHILSWRWNLHTFIKGHGDIRTQICLDSHAFFRTHEENLSVNMRVKRDSRILNFSQFCQREDLKSSAVSKNRTRPVHKPMQPAQITDPIISGSDVQVVRVCKCNLTMKCCKIG